MLIRECGAHGYRVPPSHTVIGNQAYLAESEECSVGFSLRKHPLAGLFMFAIAAPGLSQAQPAMTRTVGPQKNGSVVASDNQLLTPAGTVVQLGSPVRAKAIAINPNKRTETAAVLLMNSAEPIIVFNTKTGQVIQRYVPVSSSFTNNTAGSFTGLTYNSCSAKTTRTASATSSRSPMSIRSRAR